MFEMLEMRSEMGSGKGGGGGGGGGGPSQPASELLGSAGNYDYETLTRDRPHLIDDVNPGGVLTGKGKLIQDLPAKDQATIRSYTGGALQKEGVLPLKAEELNEILRSPAGLQPAFRVKAANIHSADLKRSLSKLKSYEGEVYRTINDVGGKIAAKYKPGKIMRQKDFLSTSRSTDASIFSYARTTGSTRFKIKSKAGKSVEQISNFKSEREILFKAGTKFKVESKVWNEGRRTWDISLTEV